MIPTKAGAAELPPSGKCCVKPHSVSSRLAVPGWEKCPTHTDISSTDAELNRLSAAAGGRTDPSADPTSGTDKVPACVVCDTFCADALGKKATLDSVCGTGVVKGTCGL